MPTLKGAIRTYGAVVRRIEREQQKQARETAKRFKVQQKLQEIENARQAVEDWENYVNMIQSVHKDCSETINWDKIQKQPAPEEPAKMSDNEELEKEKLENFKPSLFDKLFGTTEKKINKLKKQIETARIKDETDNNLRHSQYQEELNDWHELQQIADGVKNREIEAYKNAIEYFDPFSDISELGTHLNLNFESQYLDVDLKVNSDEVIPDYELKQTATGKLSKKNMAKSKFNELYQDHICSSIIRVAREIFAYLPLEFVRINAVAEMLNSSTGHIEDQPIVSVIILPDTIKKLNFKTIDPSDSMKNFVHNIKFNRTKGFDIVDKVKLIK